MAYLGANLAITAAVSDTTSTLSLSFCTSVHAGQQDSDNRHVLVVVEPESRIHGILEL